MRLPWVICNHQVRIAAVTVGQTTFFARKLVEWLMFLYKEIVKI